MPYGNSQKLGEGIDPRLFVQDFSGYADAAKMQASGLINMTDSISNAITDYAHERKDLDGKVKSGEFMLKYAEMEYPGQKEQFAALRNEMANPALSKHEQAAMADSITSMIALGVANDRYNKEFTLRQQETGMRVAENASNIRNSNLQYDATTAAVEADRQARADKSFALDQTAPGITDRLTVMAMETIPGFNPPDTTGWTPGQHDEYQKRLLPQLPEKVKRELKNIPATVNGQSVELPVLVDPYGGMDPVQLDGMVLPPKTAPENATPEELAAATATPAVTLGRQTVSPQDQELKTLEIQKTKGEIAGQKAQADQAAASAVKNKAKAESALASLRGIRNHPGRAAATGKTSYLPSIRGGDSYDFEQKLDQAKALAGTIGIEAMRGLGAMSEKEFKAATDSIAALSLGQKTETIEKELDKLISLFETNLATVPLPGGTTPAPAPADPFKAAASRLGGMIPKRLD